MFPNKFFKNILKCSKLFSKHFLATIQNIVSCSQNIYSFDTIEIFTYLFWELFECLGTFWKVLMEHSEMFPNRFFRNILSLMEHSEIFPNKFFRNIFREHFECSWTFLKSSKGTFWNVSKQNLQEHFKMFKTFFWTFLAIFIQNIVSCFQIFFHLTLRNVYKLVRKLFLNVQEHFEKF